MIGLSTAGIRSLCLIFDMRSEPKDKFEAI